MKVCPKCGGKRFWAHRVYHTDVIVDGDNNWEEDRNAYDAGNPFGPYTCENCGAEYDDLNELAEAPHEEKGVKSQKVYVLIAQFVAGDPCIVGVFGDKERARDRFKEILDEMWPKDHDSWPEDHDSVDENGHNFEECVEAMLFIKSPRYSRVDEFCLR